MKHSVSRSRASSKERAHASSPGRVPLRNQALRCGRARGGVGQFVAARAVPGDRKDDASDRDT